MFLSSGPQAHLDELTWTLNCKKRNDVKCELRHGYTTTSLSVERDTKQSTTSAVIANRSASPEPKLAKSLSSREQMTFVYWNYDKILYSNHAPWLGVNTL